MNEPAGKLDWEQVETVLGCALELSEEQRDVYLDRQPPSIRAEVESLLAAYRRSGKFLGADTAPGNGSGAPPARTPLAAGTQLGHYRIDAVIGHGGMGVVYRALDSRLKRQVAVKILFDDIAEPAARRRFQREAQMASALNHPHILTVHDVGEFDGRQYLVTEFVDGGTLKDWASAENPAWRQAVELLMGVADGLAAAHSAGVLHRDIKPDNILVGRNGYAKLADFGLAKLQERSVPEAVNQAVGTEGTRPGIIIGTIAYMSPEQALGRPTDARSDIFSFGVVLYELLAARRPFEGANDLELLQTVIHGRARPLGADVPVLLRIIVEKALEKDPADRYQSTRELVVDLRRVIRQSDEAGSETPRPLTVQTTEKRTRRNTAIVAALLLLALALVGIIVTVHLEESAPQELTYRQITNFTDSVVSPALSPDGRMIAFFRSEDWFQTPDEIYVKMLPNGEPVQVTHDPRPKYGLAFSPDGSRIAYTVSGRPDWATYTVSPLGGEPKLLLSNAAGLTWLDERRILFSEIRKAAHMGVVTSMENRSGYRRIYFPQDERAMVHLSYASPDREWVLVVEMDPIWQPCRVVPMDGSSPGRQVGPQGKCTAAAWSPDGKWMYFGVEVQGNNHLWRQRFPKGEPEQITYGLTQEEGIAVAPDGRSLMTSIGMRQTAVWIRDARGDRAISSEGYVPTTAQSGLFGTRPRFSQNGRTLYYLRRASPDAAIELWRTDLESGESENAVGGFSILEYDISPDDKEVLFSTRPSGKASQIWLATLDRRSPPQLVASAGENSPHFGTDDQILYRLSDGKTHYLARMRRDGSGRSKVASYPIGNVQTISPDRRWVVSIMPSPEGIDGGSMAVPVDGGPPRRICTGGRPVEWSPEGKFLYISVQAPSRESAGKTLVIPLRAGEMLPNLPALGIRGLEDAALFRGSRVIDGWNPSPGPDPGMFAYVKMIVHRNLFRVPLAR